jgi:hypothetical protein
MNFAVSLKVGSFIWLVNFFQIISLVLIVLDEHGLDLGNLIFELILDSVKLHVELLLVSLSLILNLDKALLDGLSDAVPLGVGIEVDRGLHDDNVNIGLHLLVVQVIELLKALLVELNFALDDGLDLAVHDAFVRLAKDGNEEVERHQNEHKDEQSVQHPDEENHELRVNS